MPTPFVSKRAPIYADVPALGKSAQEVDPHGKAADELARLYDFVTQHLKGVPYG